MYNYSMLDKTQQELPEQIHKFVDIMTRIGIPVADEKMLGPMQFLEYLGLLLNLMNLTLQISDNKRINNIERIDKLLSIYRGRKKTTVKKLQKLAGSLNFICAAIPAGKVFLASLYKLTRSDKGQVNPSHHRRVTKEVYQDLIMFKSFLQECAEERYRNRPFMIKQEKFKDQIQFYTNTANLVTRGFGCMFENDWAFGNWQATPLFADSLSPNIALLELFAIVMAVELWAELIQGQPIILQSDNKATVHNINSMKSEVPACQSLLRHLALKCLHFQIFIKAVYFTSAAKATS